MRALARGWDLQAFNLVDQVLETSVLSPAALLNHGSYGLILIALLLTGAVLVSQRGDIA